MRKMLLVSFMVLVIGFSQSPIFALTTEQWDSIYGNSKYYNGSEAGSNQCTTGSSQPPTITSVSTTAVEAENAQTIIGIAKTDNLGQKGALVGLMVADDESHFTNDANEKVPDSESNPNKQGDGSNGYSLGVFQQQIIYGWSTYTLPTDSQATDIANDNAINQLMTPAYAAEAFFGSPPGSNAPSALSKGLQNIPNWQSLEPQVAGQQVQNPGPDNPGNVAYQKAVAVFLGAANSLLTQYWNSTPAIPLPVAQTSATGTGSISTTTNPSGNCTTGTNVSCGSNSTDSKLSQVRQNIVCIAQQQLALWESQSGYPTPSYSETGYYDYSENSPEEWCADFVSWVYNQAGDPLQTTPDWKVSAVETIDSIGNKEQTFHYHAAPYTPQPGDLAIHYNSAYTQPYFHVSIYITTQDGQAQYIAGDTGSGPYPGGSIVGIETGNGYYDNDIIGYVTPD